MNDLTGIPDAERRQRLQEQLKPGERLIARGEVKLAIYLGPLLSGSFGATEKEEAMTVLAAVYDWPRRRAVELRGKELYLTLSASPDPVDVLQLEGEVKDSVESALAALWGARKQTEVKATSE